MTKKSTEQPTPPESGPPVSFNRRWYWGRAILVAVLAFIFVMWFAYPTRGNVAILWSAGLAAALFGYFVVSYYFLNR